MEDVSVGKKGSSNSGTFPSTFALLMRAHAPQHLLFSSLSGVPGSKALAQPAPANMVAPVLITGRGSSVTAKMD